MSHQHARHRLRSSRYHSYTATGASRRHRREPQKMPPHLVGPEARALDNLDPAARRDALLKPLSAHLGAETLDPASWHERSWHLDDHVGGGYIALPLPGTTAGLPPVSSRPAGHLHWAGTETAQDHPGYSEGAIDAGIRAAAEVARDLRTDNEPST